MPVDVNLSKDGIIYQREQYRKGGIGRCYWDYRDKEILKFIDAGNEKTILDIGCGEGILMEKIIQIFPDAEVFGIDPSHENVSICKQYGLKAYDGSSYELSVNKESFDCVLFIEVIEHLEYPELAIKEIYKVLKKGGKLILLFPHDSIFKLVRVLTLKFKEAFYNAGHVKQWHPTKVVNILEKNGFEITYTKNLPFYLWMISLHCLIVAKKL